jgi:hypothetical protein
MELLDQIEAYIAQAQMPPSRFGRLSAGDPRLVADLKAGRKLRCKTEDRIRSYLSANEAPNRSSGHPASLGPPDESGR